MLSVDIYIAVYHIIKAVIILLRQIVYIENDLASKIIKIQVVHIIKDRQFRRQFRPFGKEYKCRDLAFLTTEVRKEFFIRRFSRCFKRHRSPIDGRQPHLTCLSIAADIVLRIL